MMTRKRVHVVAVEEVSKGTTTLGRKQAGKGPYTRYVATVRFGRHGIARVPVRQSVAFWLMGLTP